MAKTILNNSSSLCKQCMTLVRKNVLVELKYNVRFMAEYVEGIKNDCADFLSRVKIHKFHEITPAANKIGDTIPSELFPVSKFWLF